MAARKKKTKKKGRARGARWARRISLAAAVLVVGALAALAWLLMVYPHQAASGSDTAFVVEIPRGSSARRAVRELASDGVVEHPWVFEIYLRYLGREKDLRQGRLLMARNLTPHEVVRRLTRGSLVPVRVVVPEGWNRFEISQRLERLGICPAEDFLEATSRAPDGVDAPSMEGYLFPDSYDFNEQTPATEVVLRMRENWERRVGGVIEEHRRASELLAQELGFDTHDILTLASVIEEEAAAVEERATIAGVFLNRLRSETFRPLHRLQADPTVSYGCIAEPTAAPSCAGYHGTITRPMLEDSANRYNTYRHSGLPPGPITNPGADAIAAVLDPEEHDYLYFVARGEGRHTFSPDLANHNEAVGHYRTGQ